MTDWLRPKFQRGPSTFLDEDPKDHDKTERLRTSSRVSSYLGLASTLAPSPVPSIQGHESFLIKTPDIIYERPSVDQMVESLKVAMMTKSSMDSLPIEHNSSVLHLLEAYHDIKVHLDTKDHIIFEMQERHTQVIHEYEEKLAQWEAKEQDYQSEMKNLEVILAKTEGGLEKVTIARTNSVLERALNRTSKIHTSKDSARTRRDGSTYRRVPVIRTIPLKRVPTMSTTFDVEHWRQQQLAQRQGNKSCRRRGGDGERGGAPHEEEDKDAAVGLGLSYSQGDSSEQPHIETDLGMEFESSDSSQSFSTSSGPSMLDKPLPAIPPTETTDQLPMSDIGSQTYTTPASPWVDVEQPKHIRPSQEDFSYRAGDDDQDMFSTGETTRARTKRTMLGEQQRQRAHGRWFLPTKAEEEAQAQRVDPIVTDEAHPSTSQNPQATPSTKDLKFAKKANDRIQRCDSSTSSIVTAVRDHSGRSSASTETSTNRPRLNRNSSSDTAAIAARRAITSRNNRPESSETSQTQKPNATRMPKDETSSKKCAEKHEEHLEDLPEARDE
ncbi:hypothetical protein PVAG01_04049 [Phlyctema vagabunda]|uniref:Uncharacterized protein n=1 Tax=Phlyctema vagabunda TaxID=108571 RepID=A0ABR4PN65_9HELO